VIKAIANYMNRHIININIKHFDSIDYLRSVFMDDNIITLEAGRNKRIYVFEEIDCAVDDMKNNPFLSRELVQQQLKETKKDTLSTDDIIKAVSEGKDTDKNIKPSTITTGEVLELLDGVGETDDRVIIFTTNHPEMLDKAFLRPGRIDLNLEFKKLRKVDVDDLYHLWFKTRIPMECLNKMKDYTLSQAEMGQLCFTHKKHPERIIEELLKK
jgi:SpoVK/Ycf46/Vps4 family AAA+-type ATPase